jgi:tRNA-dihydrouridine synthase B
MQTAQSLCRTQADFRIGAIPINSRVLLAPMSGVSDLGMRRIALRLGAGLAATEMVACDSYLAGDAEAVLRAEGKSVCPHAVQIVGHDAAAMSRAARAAEGAGAEVIDINMGCPAKRVAGALAGSALMRDLDRAMQIIEAVVRAVSTPVTLKMRLGWDEESVNAPELALRAEQAGVAMLTVHGRTRRQFYDGAADWAAIRAVVDAVQIPVVANGDCRDLDDAKAMLSRSGAAAIMVGRAAIGAPWLPGQISRALATHGPIAEMPPAQRRDAALEHLDSLLGALGAASGLRHARKHLSAYAMKAGAPADHRLALVTCEDPRSAAALLSDAFLYAERREAA